MKKADFVALVLGVIGGLLFSLGMCMALIAEWNAFRPGVVCGAAGLLVLVVMAVTRRRMLGKPLTLPGKRTVAAIALGTVGALVLGVGMCLVLVWQALLAGILVGLTGILLLLCLIPLTVGLK